MDLLNYYIIKLNRTKNNIVPLAVSDKNDKIQIKIEKDNLGGSSFVMDREKYETIEIETITLDDFVKQNDIKKVDFIKADIEGAERYLLMGAKNVLREFKPKLAICTYHLPDDKEVLTQLILEANPDYKIEYGPKKLYAK